MSDVSVIIEDGGSIVIEETDYDMSRLTPTIELEIETSESPKDVTAEHAIQDVCVVVSEIELKIFGWSLSDWWNKNFADLQLQVTVISGEFDALSQVTLELKAQIEDPFTGNTALSELLFQLATEVHNHYGDLSAHSELFLALQSQITDLNGELLALAENVLTLETEVHVNGNDITALASTVNSLKVQVEQLDAGMAGYGSLIAANTVSIQQIDGELTIHGSSITAIDLRLTDAEQELIANATAREALEAEITRIDGELTAWASHTLELTAQIGTSFNPAIAWEFTQDLEGWAAQEGEVNWENDALVLIGNCSAFITFSAIEGDTYPLIALMWKRVTGAAWEGAVYYKYEGGPSGWTQAKTFANIENQVDFSQTIIDVGVAFAGRRITGIAVKFSRDNGARFLLDSVGIGRRSAVGTYAAIKREELARVTRDEALSKSITEWETSLDETNAAIKQEVFNRITADKKIDLRYNITLDAHGRITGTYLKATNSYTSMKFVMDDFYMYLPGRGDLRVFQAGRIGDGTYGIILRNCLIEQTIKSQNYQRHTHNYKGWKIDKDGAAEFNEISIYNKNGDRILSSGAGLNLNETQLANDLQASMEAKILSTVDSDYLETNLEDFKQAIEDDRVTYVENLLTRNAWIETAYIGHLTVGTTQIAGEAVSSIRNTTSFSRMSSSSGLAILRHNIKVPGVALSNGGFSTGMPCDVKVDVNAKIYIPFGEWDLSEGGEGENGTGLVNNYGLFYLGRGSKVLMQFIVPQTDSYQAAFLASFSFYDSYNTKDMDGNTAHLGVGNQQYWLSLAIAANAAGAKWTVDYRSITTTVVKR